MPLKKSTELTNEAVESGDHARRALRRTWWRWLRSMLWMTWMFFGVGLVLPFIAGEYLFGHGSAWAFLLAGISFVGMFTLEEAGTRYKDLDDQRKRLKEQGVAARMNADFYASWPEVDEHA